MKRKISGKYSFMDSKNDLACHLKGKEKKKKIFFVGDVFSEYILIYSEIIQMNLICISAWK